VAAAPGSPSRAEAAKAPAFPPKIPAPAPAGHAAAELETVKAAIVERKAALKAQGMKGGAINADPQVAEMVAKLQALKAQVGSDASAPTIPAAAPAAPPAPAAPAEPVDLEKAAKKEEKKRQKDEEKRAKEEAKAKRAAEEAKKNEFPAPSVTLLNFMEQPFGNMMIASEKKTGRVFEDFSNLEKNIGQEVWVRTRVAFARKQGGKLTFLELRQGLYTLQAVTVDDMAKFAGQFPKETVVDILGKVTKCEVPTKLSISTVELQVKRLYCISRAAKDLPLQIEDAARPEADFEKDPSLVRVGQDVRLDNRVLDLRTPANQAILRIQSATCLLYRECLINEGFVEIHTPKLIATASESGASVFKLNYFDRHAYLAQSPQLYKQMALQTDLPKVFEIAPVFRAEQSFTHRHMTEFVGLDMEMHFNEHYDEVLDMLDKTFNHIFKGLNERFPAEIEAVRKQYPFEDLRFKYPCLKLKYWEAMKILREKGPAYLAKDLANAKNDFEVKKFKDHLKSVENHADDEDISTEDEKVLGRVIHDLYGEDFYMIDKFPSELRPFYTMEDPTDSQWSNSYDIFIRGEEVTSGAQRIHDSDMLVARSKKMGVDLGPIQDYVDAFKYGAYPHAGGGIGLERVVMLFLHLNNIRKSSMFPRDPTRITP
jgi:aspartyl-tRNA synthetase